jgi:hypothetical protein
MKPGLMVAILSLILAVDTALLGYAVTIEHRLTRVETQLDYLQRK